jgi:hypothetical protein
MYLDLVKSSFWAARSSKIHRLSLFITFWCGSHFERCTKSPNPPTKEFLLRPPTCPGQKAWKGAVVAIQALAPTNGCGSSHSGYQFYVLTRWKKTSLGQTLRFNDFDPQILSDLVFRFSQSMLPVLYISISWYVLIVCSMIYQNPKIVFLHPDLIYIFFLFFVSNVFTL